MKRVVILFLIVALCNGFAFGQKYQRPKVQTPVEFRSAPPGLPDPQTVADLKWFEVFNDKALQELIQAALAGNYDLREAVARIDQARANYGLERSNQFPTI